MTRMTGRAFRFPSPAWPGGLSSIWAMNSRYPPLSSCSIYSCCCSNSFSCPFFPGNPPNLQHEAVSSVILEIDFSYKKTGSSGKDVMTAIFTISFDQLALTVRQ